MAMLQVGQRLKIRAIGKKDAFYEDKKDIIGKTFVVETRELESSIIQSKGVWFKGSVRDVKAKRSLYLVAFQYRKVDAV